MQAVSPCSVAGASDGRWHSHGLPIIYLTADPLRRITQVSSAELGRRHVQMAAFLTVMRVGYPTVWLLGPPGLGVLGETTDVVLFVVLFVVLPIFSKLVFRLLVLAILRADPPARRAGERPVVTTRPRRSARANRRSPAPATHGWAGCGAPCRRSSSSPPGR